MISDYYDQTVILLDHTADTDPFSTSTSGYTTDVSLSAAVNQMSADEQVAFGQLGVNAEYKMYYSPSTEVYYGRRAQWDGDTYEIVTEPKNTLQKDHHERVLLRRVR